MYKKKAGLSDLCICVRKITKYKKNITKSYYI